MNKNIQKIVLATFLFILAYLPTILWMWDRWFARDSYYSHGILIPFITVLLIWQKRSVLKKIKIKPSPWGLRIFILGMVIHLGSLLFRVYFTSGFSMLIVLSGFILSMYGRNILKEVLSPILFLAFMIPLPLVAVVNISFQLKLLSAKIAAVFLNAVGMQAIQEGSYIKMQHVAVVVEDVCSGIRSLISLMAMGGLFAYWMKSGRVQKTILFFSSIPIAVITNTVRIAVLAMLGEVGGTQYLSGFVHSLSGVLVFAVAFLLLYGVERLLARGAFDEK